MAGEDETAYYWGLPRVMMEGDERPYYYGVPRAMMEDDEKRFYWGPTQTTQVVTEEEEQLYYGGALIIGDSPLYTPAEFYIRAFMPRDLSMESAQVVECPTCFHGGSHSHISSRFPDLEQTTMYDGRGRPKMRVSQPIVIHDPFCFKV